MSDEWQNQAACRGLSPVGNNAVKIAKATAICADCQVRAECLAYSLEHCPRVAHTEQIWGGQTDTQRLGRKTSRGPTAHPVGWDGFKHGTYYGYMAHRRYQTPQCFACLEAAARHQQFARTSRVAS